MTTIFQLRFDQNCSIQFLEQGEFRSVYPGLKLHNEVIGGIFSFKTLQSGRTVMTLDAVSIKRIAIVFAFWHKHCWRVRFRLVVSTSNGMVAFPLTRTLFLDDGKIQMPTDFKHNTALFLGLHSEADLNTLALRVFANANGVIDAMNFNGYETNISWSKLDVLSIPDELKSNLARKRKYSLKLYRANGVHRVIGNLSTQRMVSAPATPTVNIPMTPSSPEQVRFSLYIKWSLVR